VRDESFLREGLKYKKRIVVKIGSSSLTHEETGDLNLLKIERLVRVLADMRGKGKDVVLVSSGAIAVGRKTLGFVDKPSESSVKQACAAVGQAKLMMVYQKIFAEYNNVAAQVLMTKDIITNDQSRVNTLNTFEELLKLNCIPVVNENDTVATYDALGHEIEFGDNDTLSAIVAALIGADLLILLSDIDGMYTDDPRKNANASMLSFVEDIDANVLNMGKGTANSLGTGGMTTKIHAAKISTCSGADMVITNAADVLNISRIMDGREIGTLFAGKKDDGFDLHAYINE